MRIVFLFIIIGLGSIPVSSAEPICRTTFTAADPEAPHSWQVVSNWTNGLPGVGHIACFPEELKDEIDLPDWMKVVYVPMLGQGTVAGEDLAACCVGSQCLITTAS